ncbi:MAG: S-layer homology domain-containing protein, partial [Clostridia bacterium]|nr:S-layer homology domain-containing protein [Clostridia bacterium]
EFTPDGTDNTSYKLNVTCDGKTVSGFGGNMKLTLPYRADENEDADRITVSKDGDESSLDGGYDRTTGKATANASGDSGRFVLGYAPFPYTDVDEDSYCYDAVDWADLNGITEGTGEDSFSPDSTCTRAQMVTFIWRAEGSPEPVIESAPFTDIDEGAYYYKAVLWAYENGIAKGVSVDLFDPNGTVTRAQSVTFLCRTLGGTATGENPFIDVSPEAYYYDAVIWAAQSGIAAGTGEGRFSPDAPCLRAQIVTFLYRAYGER